MNHASLESIVEKQKKRYQVLRWIYEMVGDDSSEVIRSSTFYNTGRITQAETYRVLDYLAAEGLVKRVLGDVTISHKGIKEIEDSIQHPNKPTEAARIGKERADRERDEASEGEAGCS